MMIVMQMIAIANLDVFANVKEKETMSVQGRVRQEGDTMHL